jgi:hypothetical protein
VNILDISYLLVFPRISLKLKISIVAKIEFLFQVAKFYDEVPVKLIQSVEYLTNKPYWMLN